MDFKRVFDWVTLSIDEVEKGGDLGLFGLGVV